MGGGIRTVRSRPWDLLSPDPLREAASQGERQACEAQLRQLAQALETYCAKSDDRLPDPARWYDQIVPYLPPGTTLHCSTDPVAGVSYAMNKNLAGKRRREIANPSSVVIFYESTSHSRNAADTGQSWATPTRHLPGNSVMFLDGSIKSLATPPSFEVKKATPGSAAPSPHVPARTRCESRAAAARDPSPSGPRRSSRE